MTIAVATYMCSLVSHLHSSRASWDVILTQQASDSDVWRRIYFGWAVTVHEELTSFFRDKFTKLKYTLRPRLVQLACLDLFLFWLMFRTLISFPKVYSLDTINRVAHEKGNNVGTWHNHFDSGGTAEAYVARTHELGSCRAENKNRGETEVEGAWGHMNDVKGQLKEVVEGHVQGSIWGRNTRRAAFIS
jgi:hypothetical protein